MNPQQDEAPCDAAVDTDDCRCLCGSLLARLVTGGVELKCRRCKRTLLVPFEPGSRRVTKAHERIGVRSGESARSARVR